MRIAVTGASGRLGRATVPVLRDRGLSVVGIDSRPIEGGASPHIQADLSDLGQTYGALAGADAGIHLAAIPGPGGLPPEGVYATHGISTFNLFEAAATGSIRRVVRASICSPLCIPSHPRWS